MRVSVFGLGYVGAISCGCFAQDGFAVTGVDVNPDKVAAINRGISPIWEERIGGMIAEQVAAGRLSATTDAERAVAESDVSIVSVGTPSDKGGGVDLGAVTKVCREIGRAMANKSARHLVVVRSTIPPGTVKGLLAPAMDQESGLAAGEGYGLCFNPEFLREGSSVKDHYQPPFVLIGSERPEDAALAARLYEKVDGQIITCGLAEAEMIKYVCNAFHALKITFANEVGALSQAMGVDGRRVMEIVCADDKLNISPRYLMPGFAFGGSCLPKDVRALNHWARRRDLPLPLLGSLLESNRVQIERAVDRILSLGKKKVAILGLAFKPGTDDLRESPLVKVTEALLGKGLQVTVYDPAVDHSRLVGANKEYIQAQIPHLANLMSNDLAGVLAGAELVLVGHDSPEIRDAAAGLKPGTTVVDLAGVAELSVLPGVAYHPIAW